MAASPFPHHGALSPDLVHGRDEVLDELISRVAERRVTALVGPRQFGKTSLLRLLASELPEVSTVAIDLFGVQTYADLVVRLSAAMRDAIPAVRDHAVELSIEAGVDLGGLEAQLRLPARQRPNVKLLYGELVRMLVRLAGRTPLLVGFDEFQSIDAVDGAAAVLRTELQHHYRQLGLILAGSAPLVVRDMFTRHDQPFFQQADLITIGPLARAAVRDIVGTGFSDTGREAGTVADQIFALTGGHPQRTMRAADEVWRHTDRGEVADQVWGRSLLALRAAEAATLAATYDDLAGAEKKVVRILANDGALYGSAAERLGLGPGAADHARSKLLAYGKLMSASDGSVVVTDPLLADWVRQRLPL